MSSEKLALVVPAMQTFVDQKRVAGAITIVARNGSIVFFKAVGNANVDSGKPMKRDTIVRRLPCEFTETEIIVIQGRFPCVVRPLYLPS